MRNAPYSSIRNFNEHWTRINAERMKAQKTGTKEQPWRRNDAERMKDQRTGTKDKEHSQTWMRKIEQLHMDKVAHCKEDGCHVISLF